MICDRCIHSEVCGLEDNHEEALTYCSDFLGWVSVSEKLPEYGKDVLTCSNGGYIEIQSIEDSYGDIYWENQNGDWSDIDEVIAWMPLPEPYKTESKDCQDCKEFEDCPCGKDGHESGTSQGYSIGECKDFEPQKDNGFFDEIMDGESDEETYEKIKEIIAKVKEQET